MFAINGIYGDSGLQALYIVLGIYGWWLWLRGGVTDFPVTRTSPVLWAQLTCGTLAASLILRWFLARFTDSTVPDWDGLTTALSLAATYAQCRKLLESWWIWILADLIYIPTDEGWLYLALVLDLFARRIVGWAMSDTMPQDFTLAALGVALAHLRQNPARFADFWPETPWKPAWLLGVG